MSEPETAAESERRHMRELLDVQREALIGRLDGLSETQARSTPTASSLSLLALVKHSAIWEGRWFHAIVAGGQLPDRWPDTAHSATADGEDPTFALGAGDTIESVIAEYRQQVARSNEILASADLSAACARSDVVTKQIRWVALHVIEETARHAGHADIIRETIDGTRGR